jgi:hypothetical protein
MTSGWCSGLCGRQLPQEAYDRKPGGYRQSECRACRRIRTRNRLRRRYRYDTDFRARVKARVRQRYWANPAPKRAAVAARAARLKGAA